MTLSFLQLNINADNYWSNLIPFLNLHNFDVIQLQEVCGKNSFSGNIQCVRDCYEELKNVLGSPYKSELAIAQRFTSSPTAYMADAVFYKKDFELIDKNIVFLHERATPFPEDSEKYEESGRNFIHLKLKIEDKTISFINAHLAWAKTTKEQPHQTQQGEILLNFLKNLEHPFVLSGDFNLDPEQPLIQKINALARNLGKENNIASTLNERTHRARVLFPPGAVVDYIFTSRDIKVNKFDVLDKEDLSDHLALTAGFEF
jgi:endonuclease/exonuclease/phosphatase family metal-dependent hydrolase